MPELLKRAGKDQSHLADHLRVSESFISRVISGEKRLSVPKMRKAAKYLGCHMDDLVIWIEED